MTPTTTSDGRYIVDPVARTIEPVADIPASIADIMPMWDVSDRAGNHGPEVEISFWPKSFDIAPDEEAIFMVEVEAAAALLPEIIKIMSDSDQNHISVDMEGNSASACHKPMPVLQVGA